MSVKSANGSRKAQWMVAPDGRVGQIVQRGRNGVLVQFGSDGPFEWYNPDSLHSATAAQITAAGRDGVPL